MSIQRVMLRLLRLALPLLFLLLVIYGSFIINFARSKLWDTRADKPLLPYNQLERAYASRERVLVHLQQYIHVHWEQRARSQGLEKICSDHNKDVICTDVSGDIETMLAMGIPILDSKAALFKTNASHAESPLNRSSTHARSLVNSRYVQSTLCYNESGTREGGKRAVDKNFCSRLLKLFQDIQTQAQPMLLVLFTWWPDPLVDTDKYSRKLLLENCRRFRPFVETVIFSDSRLTMGNANVLDLPCFPVPEYNREKVPIFQKMADVAMAKFNATFYGYVRATTVFDATFVETLLAIKDIIIKPTKGKSPLSTLTKPIFVYGDALHYDKLGSAADLFELNEFVYARGSAKWDNPLRAMVYFAFTKHNISDVPGLIIDDDSLTPIMLARSRTLGHVVIDVGRTVTSLYTTNHVVRSPWNRKLMLPRQRDPLYNKKLISRISGSHNESSGKWSRDYFSTYNVEGKVVFKGGPEQ